MGIHSTENSKNCLIPIGQFVAETLFENPEISLTTHITGHYCQCDKKERHEMLSLIKVPAFINNVIQIHETQLVRHGMMVVGEAGSGTSTSTLILAKALTKPFEDNIMDRDGSYRKVDRLILNPKAISAGELYGKFNLLPNEWFDGIVSKLVREVMGAGKA